MERLDEFISFGNFHKRMEKERPLVIRAADIEHNIEPKKKTDVLGRCPSPLNITDKEGKIDLSVLKRLHYTSILSADQFDKELLCELCKLAAHLQLKNISAHNALYDKILAAAFFEPSTRTRLSFESAMLHLGGKTLSVTEAATTGIAKGESLLDIGQMFNSYADIVVVRHTEQNALNELSTYLRIPLINGGNGSDEHPTQALADWYALLKWKPALGYDDLPEEGRLHLGIVGTPGNMRTVKSFLLLALLFKDNIRKITIISEMADPLGKDVQAFCVKSPVKIDVTYDIQNVLKDLDIIYLNAIAFLGDGYRTLGKRFKLNGKSKLKENAVILHPLARQDELDRQLDDTDHNLYFNQADGAVFIRQALLLTIFDRFASVPKNIIKEVAE